MIYGIIAFIVWLVGAILTYSMMFENTKTQSTFNKVWFSIFWPGVILLYPIHYCYNKWFK